MTDAGVRAFEMVAALDYERTAGSPQEAQAARSIVSALHSIGLSPHTQTFEIPLYQITRASFSVTSPASNALFFDTVTPAIHRRRAWKLHSYTSKTAKIPFLHKPPAALLC